MQSYTVSCSIETARMKLSLRGKVYKWCANHHGSCDKKDRWCPACSVEREKEDDRGQVMGQDRPVIEEESQSHLSVFPYYSHLWQGLDIATKEGMLQDFQAVLQEKDKKWSGIWSKDCTGMSHLKSQDGLCIIYLKLIWIYMWNTILASTV